MSATNSATTGNTASVVVTSAERGSTQKRFPLPEGGSVKRLPNRLNCVETKSDGTEGYSTTALIYGRHNPPSLATTGPDGDTIIQPNLPGTVHILFPQTPKVIDETDTVCWQDSDGNWRSLQCPDNSESSIRVMPPSLAFKRRDGVSEHFHLAPSDKVDCKVFSPQGVEIKTEKLSTGTGFDFANGLLDPFDVYSVKCDLPDSVISSWGADKGM